MFLFTEKSIWRACLKGDNKAFQKLYTLYYPLLLNYGRKFSPDLDLVRDCIQDLFIKLIQNCQHLSDTPSVKGYLLKSFRNHLYDALRAKSTHNAMFLPCMDELLSFEEEGIALSKLEEQSEENLLIRSVFRRLSPRQQEILYLYYVVGASHTEIATALNINYQSSKNRLFRSLARLKELFELEVDRQEEMRKIEEMLISRSREYQSQIARY